MRNLFLHATLAAVLALACADLPARASGGGGTSSKTGDLRSFHGTVYQIDTVFNFVDVIMPGGTKRFYADDASVIHVHFKKAALIDIAMGEEVRGTYRLDAKGTRIVVTIDDLTSR
jgi:hypothetical protein